MNDFPAVMSPRLPKPSFIVLMLCRLQSREEIVEQRIVNSAALRVILHSETEGVFAQPHLLDDPIMRGPRLHLQVVT